MLPAPPAGAAPWVQDGRAAYGVTARGAHAFDLERGRTLWRRDLGESCRRLLLGCPALGRRGLLVADFDLRFNAGDEGALRQLIADLYQ